MTIWSGVDVGSGDGLANSLGIGGVFITTEPSEVRVQPVLARRLPHAARTNVVLLCLLISVMRRESPASP